MNANTNYVNIYTQNGIGCGMLYKPIVKKMIRLNLIRVSISGAYVLNIERYQIFRTVTPVGE